MEEREIRKEALIREVETLRKRVSELEKTHEECSEIEEHLKESEDRFRMMADSAPVFIWMSDSLEGDFSAGLEGDDSASLRRNYFNNVWLDYVGESLNRVCGEAWLEKVHAEDLQKLKDTCNVAFTARLPFKVEYRLRRMDNVYRWILDTGTPRFTSDGRFLGFIGSCVGITERKEAEERLRHMAHYDLLTGLPNRTLFFDRLKHALSQAGRYNYMMALMFLDLNNFKAINDHYGHHAGDMLLRDAAQRLIGCIRDSDTIARVGGDEFNVILSKINEKKDVQVVAEKIIVALEAPFSLDGISCYVGTSIGIGIYPSDSMDIHLLIKKADAAMYRAKQSRKGFPRSSYNFYADMQADT
ncbi:MAG: diguanylate cyclase [Nitrospirae bacterium]|nr:diguanylate cyclase [Nitrospirota bacterium]